jgi:iron complex transport system ATP-binding protein
MNEVCLDISGVEVVRSGRKILNISSLAIKNGEFVSIIGANGAGKTTLLKTICGLITPSKGRIKIADTDINRLNPWLRSNFRRQIGYIPQSAAYNSTLPFTTREIVLMGMASVKRLFSQYTKKDIHLADKWLNEVGLLRQSGQIFSSLSGGEQQKALIARALSHSPSILLLDEPTSNLDFSWKSKIIALLRVLHKRHCLTVLLVSHEINSLPLDAARTILLNEGEIIADNQTETVLTSVDIQRAYQCRIEILESGGRRFAVCTEAETE